VRVDVIVPCKNDLPQEFIKMVKREIPVNRIIVSHAYPMGTARQEAFDQVQTEWYVSLDSDVVLHPGWWGKVWPLAQGEKVGGVIGRWRYPLEPEVDLYSDAMKELERLMGRSKERTPNGLEGDLLIRRAAAEGLRVPPLSIGEDKVVRDQIVRNGYEWTYTDEVVCDHMRSMNIGASFQVGYQYYAFGLMRPRDVLRRLATSPFKTTYAFLRTGRPRVYKQVAKYALEASGCLWAWALGVKRAS